MMIDPIELSQHWEPILVFTAVVIVGNVVVVSISAFLTGYDPRTSIQAGMSLAQIGEFSFIIAGVGVSTGATDNALYSIAVAVSALTTLTTPWLIRYSDAAAKFVDRKLPRALQTFAALYGSWIEEMRLAPHDQSERAQIRRRVRMLLLDFVVVVSIVIGASVERDRLTEYVMNYTGAERRLSTILWLAGAGLILAPFCVGIIRNARGLGQALALRVLPAALEGRADLGLAPRRALIVTLQLAIVMLLGGPIVAITQPFLPPFQGAAIFSIVVIVLGINFWRGATNLQGHARAGAMTIVELLANQARGDETPAAAERGIEQLHQILPGLGDPIPIKLDGSSPAVGKTLKQLNLRSLTSATVLAIQRGDERIVVPSGAEHLEVGDTLAIAGSHEAIAAARALLTGAA
jgi:CPA2 family monovalent cation:H+ antiporter-2